MSILVSWTAENSGPLLRGLYPAGLDQSDFAGPVDNEIFPSNYVGNYTGDPAAIADFGMSEYTAPIPAEPINVVITSISGDGYLGGDTSLFYAKELTNISISATIDKPDGTRLVLPMRREDTGRVIYKFASTVGGVATFDFAFPTSGKWECDEALINTMAAGDDVFLFAGVTAIVDLTL